MSPRTIRRVVIAVCVGGIGGMIVGSIADNNGAAMTAGIVSAIAVLCLIVTTAVTGGAVAAATDGSEAEIEALAESLEAQIGTVVEAGVDERTVRVLVGSAVRLGQLRRMSR